MMEPRESLSLPKNENHDINKYTKHINDLIEDAEIEAEIESKKKNSSKNITRTLIFDVWFRAFVTNLPSD